MTAPAARPWTPPRWVAPVVVVAALLPAAWGMAALASDFFRGTRWLGSDPITKLEHFLGLWGLRFLVLTLLVTPVRRIAGWPWLHPYRRRFGLIAFTYIAMHLLTYAVLDVEINWTLLVEDVVKRPYITIGMAAFVILLVLALTSTKGWMRRLGRWWTRLHWGIYVAAVLGVVHFWMAMKADIREPAVYGAIFAALLGYRVWHSVRSRSRRRGSLRSPQPNSAPSA